MKKLLVIIVLAGCLTSQALAQETPSLKYHECGIIFSGLNSFGLRYKYGSEKTKLRLSLLATNLFLGNGNNDNNGNGEVKSKSIAYGAGFLIGFDHNLPLFGSFSLLLGAEAGLSYSYSHQTLNRSDTVYSEQISSSFTPGLSFIFGLNYVIKDHLVLGAEINPTLYYTFQDDKSKKLNEWEDKTNRIGFSLATSGAGLYIAYRFGK